MKKYVIVCAKYGEVWSSNNYVSPYTGSFHAKSVGEYFCSGHVFCLIKGQKITVFIGSLKIVLSEKMIRILNMFIKSIKTNIE